MALQINLRNSHYQTNSVSKKENYIKTGTKIAVMKLRFSDKILTDKMTYKQQFYYRYNCKLRHKISTNAQL